VYLSLTIASSLLSFLILISYQLLILVFISIIYSD
jgi:hypothetical protein